MSLETYTHTKLNRLRKQTKTSDTVSTESARHLYRYLVNELGLQPCPRNTAKRTRLVGDRYFVTMSPKKTHTHILFQVIGNI